MPNFQDEFTNYIQKAFRQIEEYIDSLIDKTYIDYKKNPHNSSNEFFLRLLLFYKKSMKLLSSYFWRVLFTILLYILCIAGIFATFIGIGDFINNISFVICMAIGIFAMHAYHLKK